MTPLYASRMNKKTVIEFVKHPTAKSVVFGYFRPDHPKVDDIRLMEMKTDFHVLMGKRWAKPAKVSEIMMWVRKVGIWGYCKHLSKHHKEIHYWIGKRAAKESVMEFVIHEVIHAGGYGSEELVCKLAGLGTFAYKAFEQQFGKKFT